MFIFSPFLVFDKKKAENPRVLGIIPLTIAIVRYVIEYLISLYTVLDGMISCSLQFVKYFSEIHLLDVHIKNNPFIFLSIL
jgi:hypothetical protein